MTARTEGKAVACDHRWFPIRALAWIMVFAVPLAATSSAAEPGRFNVLLILIDDHGGNQTSVYRDSPVRTPNMERLASRSTWFTRAYNDSPICCASRTAMLTGIHTTKTGVYYNNQGYRRTKALAGVESLPRRFLNHGYLVAGYGKIAHTPFMPDDVADFSPGYYKMHDREGDVTFTDHALLNHVIPGSRRSVPGRPTQNWDWGILPDDWDREDPRKMQQDTEQANRTIAFLGQRHAKPFFIACGFYRPHVTCTVPKRYFDQYPLESIQIPAGYVPGDLDDLPKPGRWIAAHRGEHAAVVAAGMWRECVQSKYAAITYVDDQIGRVLDALEASPHQQNTIVVFAADNGYHLGEKDHWLKFALWEQTCRVVFSISVPGFPARQVATPVSLIDIYPTLMALSGLGHPATHELDGINLTPILSGQSARRGQPVLATYGPGNHAIRDDRFRYIWYRDGNEELYDHASDPREAINLARREEYRATKEALRRWLPTINAPQVEPPGVTGMLRAVWEDEAFEK